MELAWILEFRHDLLTPIFLGLTFLGEPTFFLVAMPIGYWTLRRQTFFRLTLLLAATVFLNSALKGLFQMPRPTTIPHLVVVDGWSFPSGHAQIAAVMWGYLAWELRRRWFAAVAAAVVVGVTTSRVYLGVHREVDILVGATIGMVTVALARLWLESDPFWWKSLGPSKRSVVVAAGSVALILVLPGGVNRYTLLAGGVLTGFWVGAIWEELHVGYVRPTSVWKRFAVVLFGLAGAFLLRDLLKTLLPPSAVIDLLRYALVGLWISYFAPWLFKILGWSESGNRSLGSNPSGRHPFGQPGESGMPKQVQ